MRELDALIKKGCSVADLNELRMQVVGRDYSDKEKDLSEIDAMIAKQSNSKMDATKAEAIQKVGNCIKTLIGDRSIRRTAEDSGVAASYITGILKGKYLPSADILRKLASPEAKPQNAVTLEDLMIAAGYQTDYVEEAYKDFIYDESITVEMKDSAADTASDRINDRMKAYAEGLNASRDRYAERRREIHRYESLATGVMYKSLAEKAIHFSPVEERAGIRGYRPDMAIRISEQPVGEWWFEFKHFGSTNGEDRHRIPIIRQMLGHLIFIEPKLDRKLSIVINSEAAYESIIGYKDKLSYRGDLSVILIDEDSLTVVKEEYLAHYNEQGTKGEFYIV